MNMVNTTYNSTENMIGKLQVLKGNRKLKFYKIVNKYYDMNNGLDGDPFARNARGISKICHEVKNLMKFLQTKQQVKNMNINYKDFHYTVIKNRNEKKL